VGVEVEWGRHDRADEGELRLKPDEMALCIQKSVRLRWWSVFEGGRQEGNVSRGGLCFGGG
jgi:hypothetical protein